MGVRVELTEGAAIMTAAGPAVVVGVAPLGYVVESPLGDTRTIRYSDLEPARVISHTGVDAVVQSVRSLLESVSEDARQEAYDREEVVLTLETGFARGHRALARPGEPLHAFDPAAGRSVAQKIDAMVKVLAEEDAVDRRARRAAEDGRSPLGSRLGSPTANTIREWHRRYYRREPGGVFALVDGRRLRGYHQFPSLDPEIKRIVEEVVARLDGTTSKPRKKVIYRTVTQKALAEGFTWEQLPERTVREYLAHLLKPLGRTTRAHKTNALRATASFQSFPAVAVGQVVAMDVTRADNFCYDPFTGRPVSVEVITAIDLASRVVLAIRVIPRSALALEAGLVLVDILRPFSLAVDQNRVEDWRWAGVPEHLGLFPAALEQAALLESQARRPLRAEHHIPGVLPDSIRADRGPNFNSAYFRALCRQFRINLLLSRGAHPTDNSIMERHWETLTDCFQDAPGYKGHNVSERGSKVGRIHLRNGVPHFDGGEPALTPRQLELHIRTWVAVKYHRGWHSGLALADRSLDGEDVRMRLSPLDAFDSKVIAQGRIHVLQRPDLLYDAMPIRWGQIGPNGVEFDDLYYDCSELNEFRNVRDWTFRHPQQLLALDNRKKAGPKAAPFMYDPRDVSRYWFRHPETDDVIAVPWRREFELHAPMTAVTLHHAKGILRRRGGYGALNSRAIEREVLEVMNGIGDVDRLRADDTLADWHINMMTAASMRVSRSRYDHEEAAAASGGRAPSKSRARASSTGSRTSSPVYKQPSNLDFDPTQTAWPSLESQEGES